MRRLKLLDGSDLEIVVRILVYSALVLWCAMIAGLGVRAFLWVAGW